MRARSTEWTLAGLLLASFLALGLYYALTNPLYAKPDESYHQAFTDYLLTQRTLPAVDASKRGLEAHGPLEKEAHQPPLYYAAVAGVAAALNLQDAWTAQPNPYFLGTEIGNRSPWTPYGTALTSTPNALTAAPIAVAGRLVSLLFGVLALLFAYLLARLFVPWPLALLSTAFIGWNPQFIFIATAFSNDMASVATINLGLWLLGVAIVRGLTARRAVVLGVVIGLATLAKLGGLGLLAPLGVIAAWEAWKTRRWQPLLWAVLAGLVVLVVDSWWFWRNWQLYRDPLTTTLLPVLMGDRADPVTPAVVYDLFKFLWQAYWLDFSPGGVLFAEPAVYWVIGAVCLAAVTGAIIAYVKQPRVRPLLLLTWGWFALVLVSLLRLSLSTSIFMGGGRLLFPTAVTVGVTLAVGLAAVAGNRIVAPAVAAAALGVYALLAPARYLAPVYPQPQLLAGLEQQPAHAANVRFGDGAFELVGYDLAQAAFPSGQPALAVTYYWRVDRGDARNLSLFLQLVDPGQPAPVAQVDTYPTYGALPTADWPAGRIVVDRVLLPLPADGSLPQGRLITGLYDRADMQRVPAQSDAGAALPDNAVLLATLADGQINPVATTPP